MPIRHMQREYPMLLSESEYFVVVHCSLLGGKEAEGEGGALPYSREIVEIE